LRSSHLENKFFFLTLGLLFTIAPFITQRNIGGLGLSLSYNISIWLVASWFTSIGIALSLKQRQLKLPRHWPYLCLFPVVITVTSLIVGTKQPTYWLFRELFILGGLMFLFTLFQFKVKTAYSNKMLLLLIFAAGMHAFLGTLQTLSIGKNFFYWPAGNNFSPTGVFQQINTHASFLATCTTITLYFISLPAFKTLHHTIKLFFLLAFGLSMYVIAASGSRVGLLSILLAFPLILLCRKNQLRPNLRFLGSLLVISCFAFFLGSAGLGKTFDKASKLTEDSYANARIAMYTIGAEVVAKKPIVGHGIGGFETAWNKQASSFYSRHPNINVPTYVSHPHNELLFWAIEGGLPALISILITFAAVCIALLKCGWQRGGAYAAMLLPITLHTQVELPFYISSLHWFLWLFLIYLPLQHQVKTYPIRLSAAATKLSYSFAILLALSTTLFMYNTALAQRHMVNVLLKKEPISKLQPALNNLYFKQKAEKTLQAYSLYRAIKEDDRDKVKYFQTWAQQYIEIYPGPRMHQHLIAASFYLNPEGKGCDAIQAALTMYAHSNILKTEIKKQDCDL